MKEQKKTQLKNSKKEEPNWSVLSDSYLLGATLKDWKDDEIEMENEFQS